MSGLAGSGSCQVWITRRVRKLTTEIVPAMRLETYMIAALAAGVEAVGAAAGVHEAEHLERDGVDLPDPAVDLIGDVQRVARRVRA